MTLDLFVEYIVVAVILALSLCLFYGLITVV